VKTIFFISIQLIFILTLCTSCNESQSPKTYTPAQRDSLIQTFQRYLKQTEYDFKHADWSPLTEEDKASFEHLNYFPYDPSWRFEGPIYVYKEQQSATVLGTKSGDIRPALRYGYFEFKKNGKNYRLEVLKILPSKPGRTAHLFMGFWDKTSGKETYGGGRYIDIDENRQNHYIVDFNYAYNPYCAYSHRYSCAIPPLENRLDLAVTAGEKKFTPHHAQKDVNNKRP
jgi:uncharacterized protein (DUF1684 family)